MNRAVFALLENNMLTSLLMIMLAPLPQEAVESGITVGNSVTAFDPYHVAGPDKGTTTCPP